MCVYTCVLILTLSCWREMIRSISHSYHLSVCRFLSFPFFCISCLSSSFHSLPLALHKSQGVLYLMNIGAAPPAPTVVVYHDCKTFKNTVSCFYQLLWGNMGTDKEPRRQSAVCSYVCMYVCVFTLWVSPCSIFLCVRIHIVMGSYGFRHGNITIYLQNPFSLRISFSFLCFPMFSPEFLPFHVYSCFY